ncbi:adenylylsulfate kinase /sulfate adenylyltransferase subunit 1 [Arboricoccus pini]|uniref:Adenylyl-sulfate kinase n=1 Tax=Arboricoccus pini TaxID=1963835 RepID=A0A212R3W0_9PROT|nr:adenylyl-sulfate kinase [Arboricoccus pini]SNB66692.1 adenylylsulfate kinase /sulfate adenylyltransferase subunit 1 [Arboricoccus pini]
MTASPENDALNAPQLKIVIVGHVDHGKSTLVGRLVHDTGSLPEGKLEAIKAMSERRGMPFEWAFLMDAIQAERDQGITIDTTQIRFRTKKRPYVIIDAPGHKEFLKNMITGAASSEAALLLIDAHEGVQEQSRRHGYLLNLLGISQVVVLVNKMDLVDYSADRFGEVAKAYRTYLQELGVKPVSIIPISAREGDNIVSHSDAMPWYQGPSVIEALDRFEKIDVPTGRPLRLPVQDVYKFDHRRIIAGRIESGRLRLGDEVVFSPSNKTARIKTIEAWHVPAQPSEATPGQSIGVTLDEQIFVERGEVMSHVADAPIESAVFKAKLFWLGHNPLVVGKTYGLKLGTLESPVTVEAITRAIDTDTLASVTADRIERNGAGEVVLRAKRMLALDEYEKSPATGRFVLIEDYLPVGGGLVSMEGYADQRNLITVRSTNITAVGHAVPHAARAARNGHKGGVLWFTGLSGAGKSTLALELERELFTRGYQTYVLDGDNVRTGLNANLGFSPEDRAENIRRVGEVAALFADAGFLVISSFISPYRSDRERARAAAPEAFHEIYVKASLEACESRDPKGLYARARKGEIAEFTGISSPYEAPETPELVVPTDSLSIEECLARLIAYVDKAFKA